MPISILMSKIIFMKYLPPAEPKLPKLKMLRIQWNLGHLIFQIYRFRIYRFIIRSSSIFRNKLLMLTWIKCKPLDFKIFHSFKHCSLCWWLGPMIRLISPERNSSKWKYEFKFLYSSLETEWKVPLIRVSENWKSSKMFLNSDAKNSDLEQVLTSLRNLKNFWIFLFNGKIR